MHGCVRGVAYGADDQSSMFTLRPQPRYVSAAGPWLYYVPANFAFGSRRVKGDDGSRLRVFLLR
jgi:hypothetical protein